MKTTGQSSIIAKSNRILDVLVDSGGTLGFSDIVMRSGFVKSSTHRILSNLVAEGLVELDRGSKTYYLGPRLIKWAINAWNGVDIQRAASDELDKLARACSDNLTLAIPDELGAIYLRTVNSYTLRYVAKSGDRPTLHCTAVGKVLLAFQTPRQRERLLEQMTFEKYSETTITDRDRFESELAQVRGNGYAVSNGEEFVQVCGMACPVFDFEGSIAGSISVWSLVERTDLKQLKTMLPLLSAACQRVSQKLGYLEQPTLDH